jgi:hypothetical protein
LRGSSGIQNADAPKPADRAPDRQRFLRTVIVIGSDITSGHGHRPALVCDRICGT